MSAWVAAALEDLRAALSGKGAPLEFLPAEEASPRWVRRPEAAASGAAVVVRTSGSTGTPKETLLSAENLRASAEATAAHLGGHGQWLLSLDPSYVAGLAVLSRSLSAGTEPATLLERTTDPPAFTAAAEQLTHRRRYVSLVPTQLHRLLDHIPPDEQASGDGRLLAVLRRFDAILLGGGATSAELFDRAQRIGLNVIRTYGMSETAGGCVYDGMPLPGVTVETVAGETQGGGSTGSGTDDEAAGPVLLSGPMVALGYLDPALTAARFGTDAQGRRQYRTDDLGRLSAEGRLSILGRADDVINTGGVKVSAERIRQVLEASPQVSEAFVAGVEHSDWGQQVVAAVAAPEEPDAEALRKRVRQELGAAAAPKRFLALAAVPRLANGKPDRQELLRLFQSPPAPPSPERG